MAIANDAADREHGSVDDGDVDVDVDVEVDADV